MDYMSVAEAAAKWGLSVRRVNTLCNEERIENVCKFGKIWMIPSNAQKPADMRIKSGKYIKDKNN